MGCMGIAVQLCTTRLGESVGRASRATGSLRTRGEDEPTWLKGRVEDCIESPTKAYSRNPYSGGGAELA